MGIEPTPEHWETCAPNSNEKFETTWEQNPRLVGHFEGSDSHKGNRIIKQLAEACGSRTQTFDSQLTANDDVAASAKFQLESIGVSPEVDPNKLQRPCGV
ncbi:MAG: hypothetical protein DMG35_09145 [Acidobacteria bacterium]|nr:MAG: hypothetical protein DMG35_09145 [Acidobacteriota bacterium]